MSLFTTTTCVLYALSITMDNGKLWYTQGLFASWFKKEMHAAFMLLCGFSLLPMGVIFILKIVYFSQLKFSVLEFPAVTICNQNQFRMDRAPDDLKGLLDDFMESKRADMFGGKDRLKAFERRKYLS